MKASSYLRTNRGNRPGGRECLAPPPAAPSSSSSSSERSSSFGPAPSLKRDLPLQLSSVALAVFDSLEHRALLCANRALALARCYALGALSFARDLGRLPARGKGSLLLGALRIPPELKGGSRLTKRLALLALALALGSTGSGQLRAELPFLRGPIAPGLSLPAGIVRQPVELLPRAGNLTAETGKGVGEVVFDRDLVAESAAIDCHLEPP